MVLDGQCNHGRRRGPTIYRQEPATDDPTREERVSNLTIEVLLSKPRVKRGHLGQQECIQERSLQDYP